MGCKTYRILATMGYGTVGMIVEFPRGRPSVLSSVASMDTGYWIVLLA